MLRNWFLARTLVTPYFDPNFSMADFKEGAKHAAVLIANSLAEGDLDKVPHARALEPGVEDASESSSYTGCCRCHT